MKTLEEKKLLVQMAKMLGEPVDPSLIESIEREEQLAEAFFGSNHQTFLVVSVLSTTNNDDCVATLTWQEFY